MKTPIRKKAKPTLGWAAYDNNKPVVVILRAKHYLRHWSDVRRVRITEVKKIVVEATKKAKP